jgi:hypothetical protein
MGSIWEHMGAYGPCMCGLERKGDEKDERRVVILFHCIVIWSFWL